MCRDDRKDIGVSIQFNRFCITKIEALISALCSKLRQKNERNLAIYYYVYPCRGYSASEQTQIKIQC